MEHQSGCCSGQDGSVPTADSRGSGKDNYGRKGMRNRALCLVSQQSEVERYMIQVYGDGRNEGRNIEATRHVNKAR
jgi:hypothetical protein